jgi:hypothetical protein
MSDNPFQLDWDFAALHGAWPTGPDNAYLLNRLRDIPVDATAEGARGPVLEVGASEAIHSCRLSLLGLKTVALEPSFAMLGHARERMAEYGTHFELVRGISEKLPFPTRASTACSASRRSITWPIPGSASGR